MARERSERGENFGRLGASAADLRLGASAADLGWVGRRGVGGVGWVRWFPNREGEWGGVVSWKVVGKVEGVVVGVQWFQWRRLQRRCGLK